MNTEIDWSGWTEEFPLWIEFEGIGKGWHSEARDGKYSDKLGKYYEVGIEKRGYAIHQRPAPVAASPLGYDAVADPEVWDDSSLPPVGCKCEFRHLQTWHPAKVIGFDGNYCVVAVEGVGYKASVILSRFRPILTPEQKELAARIIAVAHMKELFKENGIWGIYDAGYRLPGAEE